MKNLFCKILNKSELSKEKSENMKLYSEVNLLFEKDKYFRIYYLFSQLFRYEKNPV